uniref:Uncharacterized protein n=1 Tax=Populus trichocarpa TaxID=3694 RepID=A0A3N7G715_POPTR
MVCNYHEYYSVSYAAEVVRSSLMIELGYASFTL